MNASRNYVTVVSGVPRSGTSLAMQMLRAGGMPLLTDDVRPADPDNPRGYFEYAPASSLARDATWVDSARGKAVKVIYALLRHLPPGFEYRVLWMRRDLEEVIASQEAMLARRGAPAEGLSQERLSAVLGAQRAEAEAWLERQSSFRHLSLEYAALLADPYRAARGIAQLLDGCLDADAMASCVEPALQRQRAG